ncbi:cytochrome P450 [Mycobacterium simiae]|uniref:Cytochrome P450 n=1 Tax=Mycobacterium simiae TaxID=1784 RepID=A0A5B1BUJ8_MYCSI|nr:cytochrome P450 [Mycobacterium simiae]
MAASWYGRVPSVLTSGTPPYHPDVGSNTVTNQAISAIKPATNESPVVTLPPTPRIPKALQGITFSISRRWTAQQLARHYGKVFTLSLPVYGPSVVVADSQLAKQVFTASPEALGNIQPNLSRVLGRGSVFALDGDDHRRRRRLLTPPFHGKSIKTYEHIIEEETLRVIADWPDGRSFATLPSMMRITLNAILRAVFGADGDQLDELRRLLPPWVTLGSRLATLPAPKRSYGRYTPWGQLVAQRRKYDAIVDKLIDDKRADTDFERQNDVLALMLRSSYEDGSPMSRNDIRDELLTLLGAGHETTAATLGWAFERLSRHPEVLAALSAEAGTDDNTVRQAVILEVQRTRTVIDIAGRHVWAPAFELGDWVIPHGYSILVSISQIHDDAELFPDPERFEPQRFLAAKPSTYAWIPFGGGTRRCVGAAFANMEMDIVLRTVLRHFTIESTTAPGERWHSRGVAYTPKKGGKSWRIDATDTVLSRA